MKLTRLVLALALLAGLPVLLAPSALAAPVTGLAPLPATLHAGHGHGHVSVGIGFGVPVTVPRPVVVAPAGYWTTRVEEVYVPGEVIGYDAWGRTVATEGYWTEQVVRVWVPAPRPVRVVHAAPAWRPRRAVYYAPPPRPRPVTYVGFGFTYVR